MQYGCSYFGCRFIEHFDEELSKMSDAGFSIVLITYSENDYFFYHSTICKMTELAKKKGFIVYLNPWGVLGIFGGEAFSKWLVDYTVIRQITNSGILAPAACINNPQTEELLLGWLDKAAESACDYIFWDEPHFYFKDFQTATGVWGCKCDACRLKFRERYGYDINNEITDDLINFRNESIVKLLNTLCATAATKHKKNNICMLPTEDTTMGGLSNWEYIKQIKNLDVISTDPYWQRKNKKVEEYVGYYCDKLQKLANEIRIPAEVWVQAYKIIGGRENEVANAIGLLQSKNADRIMFWSYKAGYPMSTLESDDYRLTWEIITRQISK